MRLALHAGGSTRQPPGMRCSRCITDALNFIRMTVFGRGWPATGT